MRARHTGPWPVVALGGEEAANTPQAPLRTPHAPRPPNLPTAIHAASASPPRLPRPAPNPPLGARPTRISVTEVDRLKSDPFAFYARAILRLSALDTVDADPGPAWRGAPDRARRVCGPVGGRAGAAAAGGPSVVLRRLGEAAVASRAYVEARLALGLSASEAFAHHRRQAQRTALITDIDAVKTVGLISLPGAVPGPVFLLGPVGAGPPVHWKMGK